MSFQDSAVIFFIALLLFGPKKLPELARQLGKLMGEFRRASNEFRMQLEDELRVSEQTEKQKQIAALEAAAPPPVTPEMTAEQATSPADPAEGNSIAQPIATSGSLELHAPETGLPLARGSVAAPVSDTFVGIPEPPPERHTSSVAEGETQAPAHHA